MPNITLVGQIPIEINHAFSITATRLSVRVSQPNTVKKGAFGPIGTAQGIEDASAQITFAMPATGPEFDLKALSANPGGFTLSYTAGAQKYALLGCRRSEKSISNDPGSGDATMDVSITATEEIAL